MKLKLSTIALVALTAFSFSSCKKDYALNLTVNPVNAGTTTGSGSFAEGEVVGITATANEGFRFVNWTKGNTDLSVEASTSYITTAEDVTLTANFVTQKIVTLGAQGNTSTPGFLSVGLNKLYTLNQANQDQANIDIFCFYEEGNDIAIGGPGSRISGIFGGEANDPVNWAVKNGTLFSEVTTLTPEWFDALPDGDAAIQSYYNDGRKKASRLTAGQIWAIKTQSEKYVLIKIISVTNGATGSVTFEYKVK